MEKSDNPHRVEKMGIQYFKDQYYFYSFLISLGLITVIVAPKFKKYFKL